MSDPRRVRSESEDFREVVRNLSEDYAPYGEDPRDKGGEWGADCSMGCIHFREMDGKAGRDWGVCVNPESHRAGLLTFEHQGCRHFQRAPDGEEDE